MGLHLSFGLGPIRYTHPLTSRRHRRTRSTPRATEPRRNPQTGLLPGQAYGYNHEGCDVSHRTEAEVVECVKSKLPPGESLAFAHDTCTIQHRTPGAAARCHGKNYS